MEKEQIIENLKEFYRVSADVLSPDNCKFYKRKDKVFVVIEHMGGRVWKDIFKIENERLKLIESQRPDGEEHEIMFLPER